MSPKKLTKLVREEVSPEEILEAIKNRVDYHMKQDAGKPKPPLPSLMSDPASFYPMNGTTPAYPAQTPLAALPPSIEERRHEDIMRMLFRIRAQRVAWWSDWSGVLKAILAAFLVFFILRYGFGYFISYLWGQS